MGETGAEAGGVEHISESLLEREKRTKHAIDFGADEIQLYGFSLYSLGLGAVVCDHWGRMYWHRPELRKLVKIYDPTETRTNRVDTAVVKQLNKSMDLNRNMKTALRELRRRFNPGLEAEIGPEVDEILRMS